MQSIKVFYILIIFVLIQPVLAQGDTSYQFIKQFELEHRDSMNGIVLSPDDNFLASCVGDGTIRIWDLSNNEQIVTLFGHTSTYSCYLDFDSTGKLLASVAGDETLRLWDWMNEVEVGSADISANASSVSFSPDDKFIVVGTRGYSDSLQIWNTEDLSFDSYLEGHNGNVFQILFDDSGSTLITAIDNDIVIWDFESRNEIRTLEGHAGEVLSLTLSPDSSLLATGDRNGFVRLWETEGFELVSIQEYDYEVWDLKFVDEHNVLLVADWYSVHVILLEDESELFLLDGSSTFDITLNSDETMLFVPNSDTIDAYSIEIAA